MTDEETKALTELKDTFGGKVLINWLKDLINADIAEVLGEVDANDAGRVGRAQGAAVRTQELLLVLEAEFIGTTGEEN